MDDEEIYMADNNFFHITSAAGIPMAVRIVRKSEPYVLAGCLTHDMDDPLVYFHSQANVDRFADQAAVPGLWQRVSSYYASTLLDGPDRRGLMLNRRIPQWNIDGDTMAEVRAWVRDELEKHR